ncbi:MAG: multicopper oxidase domain-containing protein [Deltaproteobacteria bacterium]|nr:multicopper oxidase domain-containing protein [Deltaproteobacteria bacterium]
MRRRDFLKWSLGGAATIVVGSRLPWLRGGAAFALEQGQVLDIVITDAIKEMVTHNAVNPAECYFWVYRMSVSDGAAGPVAIPLECPGPTIVATKGDTITVNITNTLDEPHAFFIPGRLPGDPPIFSSHPIAPNGGTFSGSFTVDQLGAFLYFDNLNAPVNRMMGLHGALVVMPDPNVPPGLGNKFTPYDDPTEAVQNLYNHFGDTDHFPGLAWEEGDPTPWALDPTVPNCPPFRTYVWLLHQASPNLFREVGSLPAGAIFNPQEFMQKFLRSDFDPTNQASFTPQYFTINGQSGFFGHFSPTITPIGRVGEPVIVHILNAGLWTHSMHLHGDHFYVTSKNGVVQENLLWLDTFNVEPMDRVDYTVPFTRPADCPNARGIGLPDLGLETDFGRRTWPPEEEFGVFFPAEGEDVAMDVNGNPVDLKQRLSPLCFPMHDHSEPSQTAQGGNYNLGLISGMYFTGDRTTPGFMDFPMDEDFHMMYRNIRGISATGPAPGTEPPPLGAAHQAHTR